MPRLIVPVALVALFTATALGQAPPSSRRILNRIAPPALERGISPDLSHAPGTPETRRRQSIHAASGVADRAGASSARYRPGRVIVKFRDGVSAAARVSALSAISGRATMSPRAASQDFDVVEIDQVADAEAAARAFRDRPNVEYAQAAYRVQAQLVPDDKFYSRQWNLPFINMETGWDIQPAAGSDITVAVIDTGVAFTSATAQFWAGAFSVDAEGNVGPPGSGGTLYPALGNIALQFVAAT